MRIYSTQKYLLCILALVTLMLYGFNAGNVFADVIIDNGDPETSSTGEWKISGGADSFGDDSYWSRNGSTYTWTFTPTESGYHEVSMWWTEWSSRSTNVPIEIEYAGGTDTVYINQQTNGGQWNPIKQYYFDAGVSYNITILSQPDPLSTSADAVQFIYISDEPEIIIDNGDPETSSTGEWNISGGADPFGADSYWSRDGSTYTWTFTPTESGYHEVSMWWTEWSSRSTNVPIEIEYAGGTDTVYINQQTNGGQWNPIKQYYFDAGVSYNITILSQPDPLSTSADAVQFIYISDEPEIIIDNGDPETSSTGEWNISGGADPFGADSYWSRDGSTYTWTFTPTESGYHEVSMWWTEWSSRSTSVPIEIEYAGGTDTVYINQQANGGQWNLINWYYFDAGVSYDITILSPPDPSSTSADAVRFVMVASRLPDTGQTGDYTGTFGEDSDYTINPLSYADNGDGTVTDNVTGLMWQQDWDELWHNWYSATGTYDPINNPGSTDVCGNLTLAGYSDWRLPDVYELMGIVDYGQVFPAIDNMFYGYVWSYWSSTAVTIDNLQAWYVQFGDGPVWFYNKDDDWRYYVRCVRGEQGAVHSFKDNGDGTVTDNVTGLMWQQEDDNIIRTWEEAITYCENLVFPPSTYSDWRMPNIKELRSIIDNSQYNPAMNPIAFPGTSSTYWSSTTYEMHSEYAWNVSSSYGEVSYDYKTDSHYVRCARGGQ